MARSFYTEQRKFLNATGRTGSSRLRKQLEKINKVASGGTRDSIGYRVNVRLDKASVEVFADESIIFIDRGRKPGSKQPPPQNIIDWIKELNIQFTLSNGKPMPIKQQAFIIGRSIARDGIEPTNIIDQVFNKKSFKELTTRRLKKASLEDIRLRIITLSKEI